MVPFSNDVHGWLPDRRTCTSYERPFGLSPASQRSFHPSFADPVAAIGTVTLPRIIGWMAQW